MKLRLRRQVCVCIFMCMIYVSNYNRILHFSIFIFCFYMKLVFTIEVLFSRIWSHLLGKGSTQGLPLALSSGGAEELAGSAPSRGALVLVLSLWPPGY